MARVWVYGSGAGCGGMKPVVSEGCTMSCTTITIGHTDMMGIGYHYMAMIAGYGWVQHGFSNVVAKNRERTVGYYQPIII